MPTIRMSEPSLVHCHLLDADGRRLATDEVIVSTDDGHYRPDASMGNIRVRAGVAVALLYQWPSDSEIGRRGGSIGVLVALPTPQTYVDGDLITLTWPHDYVMQVKVSATS